MTPAVRNYNDDNVPQNFEKIDFKVEIKTEIIDLTNSQSKSSQIIDENVPQFLMNQTYDVIPEVSIDYDYTKFDQEKITENKNVADISDEKLLKKNCPVLPRINNEDVLKTCGNLDHTNTDNIKEISNTISMEISNGLSIDNQKTVKSTFKRKESANDDIEDIINKSKESYSKNLNLLYIELNPCKQLECTLTETNHVSDNNTVSKKSNDDGGSVRKKRKLFDKDIFEWEQEQVQFI